MRLIFHGELRDRFGDSVNMCADTVAEAIEGYSRQVDWPTDLLIDAVGYDTSDKLQDSAEEVHLIPSMRGGGGKFGQIIIGAALIAAAFIALPATGGFAASSLASSLLVSGSMMVLMGVVGLFLKAPKIKNVNDPDASKYLAVNANTTAIGTPITMAWGLINLSGHWLSLQSDSKNLSHGVFPTNPT